MAEEKNISSNILKAALPPKLTPTQPNIALPPQPDNITIVLNAVQQLLNRMSKVEIITIKNGANIDIVRKTIELLEKEFKFIEKKANLE